MHFESHGRVPSRHRKKTNQKPEVLHRQTVAAREQDSIVLAEALWNPQLSIRPPRSLSYSQSFLRWTSSIPKGILMRSLREEVVLQCVASIRHDRGTD